MTHRLLFRAGLIAAGTTIAFGVVTIVTQLNRPEVTGSESVLAGLLLLSGVLGGAMAFLGLTRLDRREGTDRQALETRSAELEETNAQLRLALAERSQAERRFRALVEHAPEAIVVYDADTGVFCEANPRAAELFGLPLEQLVGGCGPADLSPERQPDGSPSGDLVREKADQALAGEFPTFEWQHRAADGTLIDCVISLTRLPHATRRLVRGTLTDVGERRQATQARRALEEQLAQAQKLETIGQLTGGVAHDFNNLLTVVMGNLELLQDMKQDPDAQALIEDAVTAAQRGATLTHSMLSFARRAHLSPVRLDLNETLAGMQAWMSRTLPETIRATSRYEADLWPVKADEAAVESAILNLVVNARDAMSGGGALTLETGNVTITDAESAEIELAPGRYATLTVGDTGAGISAEDLPRVFDPFFSTKTKGRGQNSGLGLSMIHGFTKQSGGAVSILSEVGEGTRVQLFFPALEADAPGPAGKTPVAHPHPAPPARILLAEDQDDVLTVLKRALEASGHQVIAARNGDVAADLFALFRPIDLLISDVVMPGKLQGPDLAARLRRCKPDLPVILMSGYGFPNGLAETKPGPRDFNLMKPVPRDRLQQTVCAALTGKLQLRKICCL